MRRAVFHDSGVIDDGDDTINVPALSGLSAHLADTSDAHDASAISFSPTGSIGSTDVQAAIAEVAAEATGAVSSVFGRTGGVVAVTGDYYGAVAAALTGATQASRYAGATASGPPLSGTFVKGDWVVAQDGHIWICTTGGTPGSWADIGGGSTVDDATISTSDVTTNNASTSKHGWLRKLDNDSTHFLDGTGGWSTPAGTDIAATVHAATGKTTPVDNDELALVDSAASNVLKKLLWSNLKATLKTYFDTLYTASGGGLTLICHSTLGSDQASFDTNTILGGNIPNTYKHLLIQGMFRTDRSALQDPMNLVYNNDASSSNYESQRLEGNNATASATRLATLNGGYVGSVNGATAPASSFAQAMITVASYNSTAFYKTFLGETFGWIDTANVDVMRNGGVWKNTAAVTRLALVPAVGTVFKTGSQFSLYGMP